jgi:hypothetical protein
MGRASREKRNRNRPPEDTVGRITQIQGEVARGILREHGRTAEGLLALALNASGWAGKRASDLAGTTMPTPACCAGCPWCCYLTVFALPHEVLLTAQWLRDEWPSERFQEVFERVQGVASRVRGLNYRKRIELRIPCPLLQGARCLAYNVRPANCIGWNSTDASRCESYVNGNDEAIIQMNAQIGETVNAIAKATANALIAYNDTSMHTLEFSHALSIALEDADAITHWLSGEPIFARARLDEDEAWLRESKRFQRKGLL